MKLYEVHSVDDNLKHEFIASYIESKKDIASDVEQMLDELSYEQFEQLAQHPKIKDMAMDNYDYADDTGETTYIDNETLRQAIYDVVKGQSFKE